MELIYQAPCAKLEKLERLWFQLSNVSCNLKCKHCYLSCAPNNKKKNFLAIDKVKNALENIQNEAVKEIYLTGGEPMVHPDFNNIIRLCLNKTNVTVLTNGTLINDKKARFLRQIEENYDYEIIFRVSLDHFTEGRNDEFRGKGSFKKALSGIQNLIKNGFNPIITCVNMRNEAPEILRNGFKELFSRYDFELEDINLKIVPLLKMGEYTRFHAGFDDKAIVESSDLEGVNISMFDCSTSRVVTIDGIYSCPTLVSDPRGKVGNDLNNFAKRVFLETPACYTCVKNEKRLFGNDW